jgi:tetratricopeptide (TPR) repeat protein
MKLYEVPPAREANSQPPRKLPIISKLPDQEPKERVELIEAFLKQYPNRGTPLRLHQMATASYQQLNNYEKMVEYGEKTLQALPANPATLSVLALAYAYHGEADKALDRASRSIGVLEKTDCAGHVDPARFMAERNQYLASNYASMGSASLTKFEEARKARPRKGSRCCTACSGGSIEPAGWNTRQRGVPKRPNLQRLVQLLLCCLPIAPKLLPWRKRMGISHGPWS